MLKSSHRLSFLVRYIGKVPHSSLLPKNVANSKSHGDGHSSGNGISNGGGVGSTSSSSWLRQPPPPTGVLKNSAAAMNIDGSALSNGGSSKPHIVTNSDLYSPRGRRFSCGDGAESVHEIRDNFHQHSSRFLLNSSINLHPQNTASIVPASGNG